MKRLFVILILLSAISLSGQDKTETKKWTIDPETGDTVYVQETIISVTEDITPRNNMIAVNPLKFFLFYNITYYHKIEDQTVLGIGIQAPTISGVDGIGINAEIRFHPKGKNMRGFYIAPNISYNNLEGTGVFSIGGLVGWQWFPGEEFAIGLGIGVDYYAFKGDENDLSDFNGTAPALRFDIGYAW
ncbi:MAG: hypothetical protein JW995_04650 [Melioribacteraceae bacterium]|nr:hypothetical protein [Melioribacteraceae bacterium]